MASMAIATVAFLLTFTMVSSTNVSSPQPPNPPAKPTTCDLPDALKFGMCADLLTYLMQIVLGTPPETPCCSLMQELVDLEAAVCLCTVMKANVFGFNILNVPIPMNLLLTYCGKNVPKDFQCA